MDTSLPPQVGLAGSNSSAYGKVSIVSFLGMDNIWLTPSFDESAAITAAAALGPLRPLNTVHKGWTSIAFLDPGYSDGALHSIGLIAA